jgi:hypothetical protein
MTVGGDNMLVVIMPEVVAVSVGVISPVSSGIRIESAALAVIYAIVTTLAVRFAIGTCASGQGSAITRYGYGFQVAQQSPFSGRDDGAQHEDVLQSLCYVIRTRLILRSYEVILQLLGYGVIGGSIRFGIFLTLLLLTGKIPQMLPFSEVAWFDAMLTLLLVLPIFQTVNEGIESASGRNIMWLKSSHASQPGVSFQSFCPLGDAGVFEQDHQEQSSKHAHWLIWLLSSWVWRIQ